MVLFNNIPEIMRELNHWVLWTKGKVPHQINGKPAKSNDPNTWSSFSNVLKCFDRTIYEGIGFMFAGSGITGIDIDHCIENGQISTLAQEIIDKCNSYTEKSPSGTGIHIYIQGVVPRAVKMEIEMYSEGRYFTVTGDKLNDLNIESRQNVLDQLYKKYSKESFDGIMTYPIVGRRIEPGLNDDEILQRAFNNPRNGSKIKALYDGDMNRYDNDHSRADLALCGYLAPWLDRDFSRIDRAITNSGLYREKWDRPDYKLRTINRAISKCSLATLTSKECNARNFDEVGIAQEQSPSEIYDRQYLEYVDLIISQMDSDEDPSYEEFFPYEEKFFDADAFSYEELLEEEYLVREEQEFAERNTIEDAMSFDYQYRLIAREYEENFTELRRIPRICYSSINALIVEQDLWLEDEVLDDQLLLMNDTDLQQLAESYVISSDLKFQEYNCLDFIAFAKDLQHEQEQMKEQSSVYYDEILEDDLGLDDEVLDSQILIVNDTDFQLSDDYEINEISSELQFEEYNHLVYLAYEVQDEQELMYKERSSVYYDEQCRNIKRIISILNTVDTGDEKINKADCDLDITRVSLQELIFTEDDTLALLPTEKRIKLNQQQGEQKTKLQQQINNPEDLLSKTKSVNEKQEQETDLKAEVLLERTKTEKTSWWRRLLRKFF